MSSTHGPVNEKSVKGMEALSLQETAPQEVPPPYSESQEQPHVATRSMSGGRLQKPIAIPATMPKLGSPFLRAYPPSLEGFGLPKEVFMPLIDDLNRVAVKNPPLQVLGLASNIVGFLPVHGAPIAGAVMGATSALGTYVVSKGRTELFLRKANKEIFKPRGLKVEIGKADALAKVANMPHLNAEGKIDKETALLDPVESWELTPSVTGQERRLRAFEPWIAELQLQDLPALETSKNPLSKWSAAASEKERKKGEKRMLKSRRKAYKKGAGGVDEKYERRMKKLEIQAVAAEKTGDPKAMAKVEMRQFKAERKREKRMAKSGKAHGKNKEEKGAHKILWLIIRNLDADSGEGPDPYTEGPTDISDISSSDSDYSSSSDNSDEEQHDGQRMHVRDAKS